MAQSSSKATRVLTPVDRLQQTLVKTCFWDEVDQLLYIDARKVFPREGVVTILGWDSMMMDSHMIPSYPSFFKITQWSKQGPYTDWLKQIPKWVLESCGLFPSHQMTLLHYAGKYPQILELLDHAPMLAWRLVTSDLKEPEIVALMSGKRTQIAETLGWPGKVDTVKFLTNLRLRWVDQNIAEQIDVCLLDDQRLTALQDLPRINSMALTLASRFPELIGSRLHHALAQMPCRPMQCQSMVALLEDAYRLSEFLQLEPLEVDQIGKCRYLVEVTKLYRNWMARVLTEDTLESDTGLSARLSPVPTRLVEKSEWHALSILQAHAWFIGFPQNQVVELYAWQDEEGVWAALLDEQIALDLAREQKSLSQDAVIRVRGLENSLAGAKQLSALHLWQAQRLKQTD